MARCSNCNAPLPDASLLCAWCGGRNDIDLKGIHYYTAPDNDSPRICPRCDTGLKSVDLNLNGRFLIERCKAHGGWLDGGELRHLMEWMMMGDKLLDQERQEQMHKGELKRESEQRRKLGGYGGEGSPFGSFGDPLRRSGPVRYRLQGHPVF